MRPLHRLFPSLLALCPAPALLAQEANCDELTITSVLYAAFDPNALEVDVSGTGPSFFSYPSFSLVNTDGDTVARETVNFFGIGAGEQQHRMDLLPGFSLPASPFTGTLVLSFFTVGGDSTCSWALNDQALCPPLPCAELQPYVWGSQAVTVDFDWSITDQDNNTVGTGQFHLDSTVNVQDLDTLCLPPGQYTMHLQQQEEVDGNYTFGLTRNLFMMMGPSTTFEPGTTGHLPFFFYQPCTEGSQAIDEPTADRFVLSLQNGTLQITSTADAPLGSIDILDAHGRLITRAGANGPTTDIDLSGIASGLYFVRSLEMGITQRFVLPNSL